MGSKQAVLEFVVGHILGLEGDTILDAFSGSGCVAYALKASGKRVIANDYLHFAYHIAHATVENDSFTLTKDDISQLLRFNRRAKHFIRRTFSGLYFSEADCSFLDHTYANIRAVRNPFKRSLALASLCRACMKKRPRGIFTFVGRKGWDKRKDLRMSMEDQFIRAISEFNAAVFSNKRKNRAMCLDVFALPPLGADIVYMDTPYVSPHSDCDYTRRYHFIEGLCRYWEGLEIQARTTTKKIKSYPTAFSSSKTVHESFLRLFHHFRDSKLVVSYGSNGIPNREEMTALLRTVKRSVNVVETSHKYCFGNHRHKVGDNNNEVKEYLFIGT